MRPGPYEHLRYDRVFDALEDLERTAADRGASHAALALAWLLAHPAHGGRRRPAPSSTSSRSREALELRLTPAERDELTALFA